MALLSFCCRVQSLLYASRPLKKHQKGGLFKGFLLAWPALFQADIPSHSPHVRMSCAVGQKVISLVYTYLIASDFAYNKSSQSSALL